MFWNVSYKLQQTDWCREVWIHLDLSANDLTYVPDTLLNQSCAQKVSSLILSHNRLYSLTQGTLDPLTRLKHLDLSHNVLSFLPPGSLPSALYCVDLSFNNLTELREDVFNALIELKSLNLSHNSIREIQLGVFHKGMKGLKWINLAYNNLTTLEPWPYVLSTSVFVNLSHNMISHLTNRMGETLKNEMVGLGVDLTYNNLMTINQTELSSYVGGKTLLAMDFYQLFLMNVKNNPLVCDCHMNWVVEATRNSLLSYNSEAQTYFTCAAPNSLQGRNLGYLLKHPHLLVCDVTDDCPEGCECLDTPHLRYLAITCPPSRHNYTHIPRTLPGRGPLSLNLSRQALSSLEARSGDVIRMRVLDVSNNRVKQVLNSFLDAASNLQVLDLRNNLLTSLPAQLQRLSVSNLRLSGNPLQCSCDLVWFGNWVKAVADNVTSSFNAESASSLGSGFKAKSAANTPKGVPGMVTLQCFLSNGKKVDVVDTSKWGLDCGSQVTLHAIVGGGVALVVVLAAMGMCWRWRYFIRVFADYMLHEWPSCCVDKGEPVKHHVYDMPRAEVLEEYDVYISLDEDDEKISVWASTWLLPLLENRGRNPPRVYLPLRQELPGVCKAESRVERIVQSNKVLVILSPGYVNNGWCRHEFDHACRHLQNYNPKNLVIVVMDNDPDVRRYINVGKTPVKEIPVNKALPTQPEHQKGGSVICRVNVEGCNGDAKRKSGGDVVIEMAQYGGAGAQDPVIVVHENGARNTNVDQERARINDTGESRGNGLHTDQKRKQNIDAGENDATVDQAGVHDIAVVMNGGIVTKVDLNKNADGDSGMNVDVNFPGDENMANKGDIVNGAQSTNTVLLVNFDHAVTYDKPKINGDDAVYFSRENAPNNGRNDGVTIVNNRNERVINVDKRGIIKNKNGQTSGRQGKKIGQRRNKREILRKAQAEQIATEELEGKQLRQRQFLEELSQYTEDGQQVALEPLRSFLLEGRFVSASDWLLKYKLPFEISRIRKDVDLIDCD
ncbi:hypothetical protein V1264_013571 [Littorina saxatilis]|uniref:TIR domain-containing protein n=2 Tax=Littorina saxatilis TaxID=31220 RepID=A0AAN9BQZ4_9CAEN